MGLAKAELGDMPLTAPSLVKQQLKIICKPFAPFCPRLVSCGLHLSLGCSVCMLRLLHSDMLFCTVAFMSMLTQHYCVKTAIQAETESLVNQCWRRTFKDMFASQMSLGRHAGANLRLSSTRT